MLPQHLQLKVLSMLDDSAFDKAVKGAGPPGRGAPVRADATFLQRMGTPFSAKRAVDDIKARGLAVFDHVMGADMASATRSGVEGVAASGLMRRARMGKDSTQWADTRARGDEMIWFNDLLAALEQASDSVGEGHLEAGGDDAGSPRVDHVDAGSIQAVGAAVKHLQSLGAEVCTAIGGQFECQRMTFQVARYADGARYVRHSDVGPQTPDRRLTCILYLNPDWKKEDGGELRLYLPIGTSHASAQGSQGHTNACDVAPLMNRLVIFRSEVCLLRALVFWLLKPSLTARQAFPSVPIP